MENSALYAIAAVIVLGVGAQWLSWRLKLPAILALLVIGLLLGPATGLLNPDEMFGDLLFPMVSLGVALVLFEGGLTLRFSDLRGHGAAVSNLVSWGALLNWFLIAAGSWWVTGLSGPMALLFAALVVVTGPTVVNPLLRTMRATPEVTQLLRWEGILIDPVGALLAVLVFQFISAGEQSYLLLFKSVGSGLAVGALAALTLGHALRRHWIPEYLLNAVALAWVVTAFVGSDYLAHESGLLAVTVMGIWLGNNARRGRAGTAQFQGKPVDPDHFHACSSCWGRASTRDISWPRAGRAWVYCWWCCWPVRSWSGRPPPAATTAGGRRPWSPGLRPGESWRPPCHRCSRCGCRRRATNTPQCWCPTPSW